MRLFHDEILESVLAVIEIKTFTYFNKASNLSDYLKVDIVKDFKKLGNLKIPSILKYEMLMFEKFDILSEEQMVSIIQEARINHVSILSNEKRLHGSWP